MRTTLTYFTSSFVFCLAAIVCGYMVAGPTAITTILFLTILEIALSFDNAVVNAGILADWDEVWRRRFLTWGIILAVFVMRLVFPLLIVGFVGHMNPFSALDLAISHPQEYSRLMTSAHHQVAAFGGIFLLMVFFSFFVARQKTEHWLDHIEKPMMHLGRIAAVEIAMALLILMGAANLLAQPQQGEFIVAGLWGLVAYVLTKGIASLLSHPEENHAQHLVKQGVGGFLYLELLDASFSFDGVLGAFAITNNLFVIMVGLGAGAMFVRSFTLLLVNHRTLQQYRYLEHGAFWAIGSLAVLMLFGVHFEIPEALTGLVGAILILAALSSSILANRKKL